MSNSQDVITNKLNNHKKLNSSMGDYLNTLLVDNNEGNGATFSVMTPIEAKNQSISKLPLKSSNNTSLAVLIGKEDLENNSFKNGPSFETLEEPRHFTLLKSLLLCCRK